MRMTLFRNLRLVDSEFKSHTEKMAFVTEKGIIRWLGPQNKVPKTFKIRTNVDLKNSLVFPSFIECHTHSVFAGSRAEEFELRNRGATYLEIAQKGGGILSTMRATREASSKNLLSETQKRVDRFLKQGVSTLEIKSGYSLDLVNEVKLLSVVKKLEGPRIISTFLGAHAKPPEFATHSEYLQYLVSAVLPVIKKKKLADRVDIFIEHGFFEKMESQAFLKQAANFGFDLTVHANQLSLSAGAEVALDLNAKSADHLIFMNEGLIKAFAKSETVAVLLPMADLYLKCAYPPARKLIDAGACVALATDFNPGSCPSQDLATVGLLARLEMKMTLPEVFKAYTFGAACALGIQNEEGRLQVGQYANFISTQASLADFFYSAGYTPEHQLFIRGQALT